MSLQAWLKKDERLKIQFLTIYCQEKKYITSHPDLQSGKIYISDLQPIESHLSNKGVIESIFNIPKVRFFISNPIYEQLKKDFRIFKFNFNNKEKNRVKKQLFIDQETMNRLEKIIKVNNLDTIQNGLNFLMNGLSLRMKELIEINRQYSTKIQSQSEQIEIFKKINDQNKERNKILITQHNKKIENISNSLSNYLTKDFQTQLNQSLENILDKQAYTAVLESEAISSLLHKLFEEVKTKIDEATSMIEVQDIVHSQIT